MIKKINSEDLALFRKKNKNKIIGLAHGVFDLYHYGHLLHLKKCKKNCDILIVSVTRDEFINKAPNRPIYKINQRLEMLSANKFVDYVVESQGKTALNVINNLKPNLFFKGSEYKDFHKDYTQDILLEKNCVEKNGGKISFTFEKTMSSSNLINRFSNEFNPKTLHYLKKIKLKITFEKIKKTLKKIENLNVLCIGEVILDEYIFTKPMSKSPKEHLISVEQNKIEIYGGGILATVNHISSFVNSCDLLTVLGDNSQDLKLLNGKISKKVKKYFLKQKDAELIKKTRFLDEYNNKLFQYSNKKKYDLSNQTQNKIINFLKKKKNFYDIVLIHDFGHGLITEKIIKYIEKNIKFYCVNVQTNSSNLGFNYITKFKKIGYFSIDEPEARLALQDSKSGSKKLLKNLSKFIKFKTGSITFGKHGAYVGNAKKVEFLPALNQYPTDTLGAGDAFFSISSLVSKIENDPSLVGFFGNVAGVFAISYLGHRKYINKEIFLNYCKTYLSV